MRLHEAMRNQSSPRRAPGGPGIEPRWIQGAKLAYLWLRREPAVLCAKVHHTNDKRCIFRCNYQALLTPITLKETI
jgi:hypothetical protein